MRTKIDIIVNAWVKRFLTEGIDGLKTRAGRGRKPIMDYSDEQAVRLAIEQDRQSVRKAKEAWQQATGKKASDMTFKRFLSAVVLDNATVHRNHKMKEMRLIWEKRGLFLFYLPPYSPHLNIGHLQKTQV